MSTICQDFRQSEGFQGLMRQSGCRIASLSDGEVAYITPLLVMPLLSRIYLQRVRNLGALATTRKLAQRHRAIIARVAPQVVVGSPEAIEWEAALQRHGYQPDPAPIAPTKTILVDLRASEDELLNKMKSKTRYNIRLVQRRGLTAKVHSGADLLGDDGQLIEFHTIYSQNCQRIGMKLPPLQALRRIFTGLGKGLFTVHVYLGDQECGAVAAFISSPEVVSYQFNGTTEAGRHDFAADLAAWEGIQEARRLGCSSFDFDGIYDERYSGNEDWKGFSRFKAGFGGDEILFIGSFVKRWPWH